MATEIKNSLTTKTGLESFKDYLAKSSVKEWLGKSLFSEEKAEKFCSNILGAVSANPTLLECSYSSILSAGLIANDLNLSLEPSLGFAYLLPFKNKDTGVKDVTFVISYKGYIQLALRTGRYHKINVMEVKQGEFIKYDPFNEVFEGQYISEPEKRAQAPTVGYYAMFEKNDGFFKMEYWTKDKVLAHADRYSPAFSKNETTKTIKGVNYKVVSYADYVAGEYDKRTEWLYSSFWYKDFDFMAKKTVIRSLFSKWGELSTEEEKIYTDDTNRYNLTEQAPVNLTKVFMQNEIQEAQEDFFEGAETQGVIEEDNLIIEDKKTAKKKAVTPKQASLDDIQIDEKELPFK